MKAGDKLAQSLEGRRAESGANENGRHSRRLIASCYRKPAQHSMLWLWWLSWFFARLGCSPTPFSACSA
jgi:hypothetical protein